jgi:capsular polysaccharide biosynthesis protein
MARDIEILFRHWVRFALLLVVLPLPVSVATLVYFRTVQATTNIWVESPAFYGSTPSTVPGWNQYLTPAQNETDQLNQYLQTTSFLRAVNDEMARSGVATSAERNKLIGAVPKGMHVIANGSHVVTINFSCSHATSCTAVLSATIQVFQNNLANSLKAQQQLSTSFLQSQLASAQQSADASEAALEKYLSDHPGVLVASSGQQVAYPELNRLVTKAQSDRDQVNQLQGQLAQAQFTFAYADTFIKTSTKVVDAPQIVSGGLMGDGSSLKRAAVVWLAAAGVAAAYLVLLVWIDQTARDTKELVSRLSVPVLATVPRLAAKEKF